jgi:hypothetical protein
MDAFRRAIGHRDRSRACVDPHISLDLNDLDLAASRVDPQIPVRLPDNDPTGVRVDVEITSQIGSLDCTDPMIDLRRLAGGDSNPNVGPELKPLSLPTYADPLGIEQREKLGDPAIAFSFLPTMNLAPVPSAHRRVDKPVLVIERQPNEEATLPVLRNFEIDSVRIRIGSSNRYIDLEAISLVAFDTDFSDQVSKVEPIPGQGEVSLELVGT